MAQAQICDCDHTKRDHKKDERKKNNKTISIEYLECDWANCSCKKYHFKKLRDAGDRRIIV